MPDLSNPITTDGQYDFKEGALWKYSGVEAQFVAQGTFGSAVVKLQGSVDGTTFHDIGPDTTKTSPGHGLFKWLGRHLRVDVSGSTGSTSISVFVLAANR